MLIRPLGNTNSPKSENNFIRVENSPYDFDEYFQTNKPDSGKGILSSGKIKS